MLLIIISTHVVFADRRHRGAHPNAHNDRSSSSDSGKRPLSASRLSHTPSPLGINATGFNSQRAPHRYVFVCVCDEICDVVPVCFD